MTETPIVTPSTEYSIVWTLSKGDAVDTNSEDIFGNEEKMDRDDNGIPIYSIDEGSGRPGENNDSVSATPSYFHEDYRWDSVTLSYDSNGDLKKPLKGYKVRAQVFGLRVQPQKPDNPDPGPGLEFNGFVDFRVNSISIYSEDANGGGTWVYPDDYEDDYDRRHPKQYGGVILTADNTPTNIKSGEKFEAGIDAGPKDDGVVPWTDSDGRGQEAISQYNYIDVFDEAKFSYIPRNTYENKKMDDSEGFPRTPLYPDVKDANGLAAPIYPMNAITSFLPDGRESVTVKYKVEIDVTALNKNGSPINIPVQNTSITIKQKVEQDTSDYISQLENLGKLCQFQNPGGFTQEELSPNYNYDYPYTIVSTSEPSERDDGKPLERGDVWYNPSEDERLTRDIGDVPEEIEIIKEGHRYRDAQNVVAMYSFPTDDNAYPPGRPARGYLNVFKEGVIIPYGLFLDIETKDGKIVSATISPSSNPRGWSDGDIVKVVGGSNDAELRISIKDGPGWSKKYINKY